MKKYLPIFILLVCVAAFAFGLATLFKLRFDVGDVYPPYSSLRSDPLGTMAFYESLEKIPGLSTHRDFSTTDRLPEEPGTVYLHLAADRYDWEWLPPDLFHELKNFLARGGRLVIAFYPQTDNSNRYRFDDDDQTNEVKSAQAKTKREKMTPRKSVKKHNQSADRKSDISPEVEWQFHIGFQELIPSEGSYAPVSVLNKTDLPLPRRLDWHSGMIFTNCDSAWRIIYARGTNAVVIERRFGGGSIVMATDSYFISNEAMSQDRHADLLAWLVGANKNVVFDEAHLGITETGGVSTLMWKYHLHALVAGLLLLAGLFIWKNGTSLLPPPQEEKKENVIAGKDAISGFVNLLRRSIPPRDLLATCFAEWEKSGGRTGMAPVARQQQAEIIIQAENALPEKQRNPVAAYKKITEALRNKKYEH